MSKTFTVNEAGQGTHDIRLDDGCICVTGIPFSDQILRDIARVIQTEKTCPERLGQTSDVVPARH